MVLTRRSSSRLHGRDLASSASLSGPGLGQGAGARTTWSDPRGRATAVPADEVSVNVVFDVGPYRIESQTPGHFACAAVARRPSTSSISSRYRPRRRMAQAHGARAGCHVVVARLYREQFAGMGSIRLLDIPATIVAGALLQCSATQDSRSANVRRRIAASAQPRSDRTGRERRRIQREPVPAEEPPTTRSPSARQVPRFWSSEHDSTMVLAASVIRHELGRRHRDRREGRSHWSSSSRVWTEADHQLALGPLPKGPRRFGRFLSPSPGSASMTGFADPAYDAAVARGDLAQPRRSSTARCPPRCCTSREPLRPSIRGFAATSHRARPHGGGWPICTCAIVRRGRGRARREVPDLRAAGACGGRASCRSPPSV